MTQRMKAAQVTRHGELDAVQWRDVPRPVPGVGEVRVDIRTAGMNHLDLWVRRGVEGHTFPLPLILGSDGAGVVVERGPGAESVAEGSEVIISPATSCGACESCLGGHDPLCRSYQILGEGRDGTCAESIVVPVANLIPKPAGVGWEDAGCFGLVALTAWTMLVDRAQVRPTDSILVLAGTSGVGSLAIQIAKLHGCRVIATAGGSEKCGKLEELGADETIDHSTEDIAARVRTLTGKRGVDVVFEHVGAATWKSSLRSLAWGGRLVTCGATTGALVETDLRMIFFKSLSILGSTMGSKGTVPRLVELLAQGRLKPMIGKTLRMSEVRRGHELLENREVLGKIVLTNEEGLQ